MDTLEQMRQLAKEEAQQGHYERAAELYEALLRGDPDDVSAMLALAFLYFEPLHKEWVAEPLYERALEITPNNCEALFWSAWRDLIFYGLPEQLDTVREKLLGIISVDPDNRAGYTSHAYATLGSDTFSSLIEDRERLRLLERAVELAPNLPTHHRDLASWYESHGRLEDALSELRRAVHHTTPYVEIQQEPQIRYLQTVLEGRGDSPLGRLLSKIDSIRARLEAK